MSHRSFTSDRFTMLMACASPGSALAYHLGLATFETGMLRRDKATIEAEAEASKWTVEALIAAGRATVLP
jgi:hypothetical protein